MEAIAKVQVRYDGGMVENADRIRGFEKYLGSRIIGLWFIGFVEGEVKRLYISMTHKFFSCGWVTCTVVFLR